MTSKPIQGEGAGSLLKGTCLELRYATRLSVALETSSAPVFSRIDLAREIHS